MDAAASQEGNPKVYTTPRWVQVWFLRRSRDNWKKKYQVLKADAKRLANRVNDVTHSRQHWQQQVKALQEENAALKQAALKKYRPPARAQG